MFLRIGEPRHSTLLLAEDAAVNCAGPTKLVGMSHCRAKMMTCAPAKDRLVTVAVILAGA